MDDTDEQVKAKIEALRKAILRLCGEVFSADDNINALAYGMGLCCDLLIRNMVQLPETPSLPGERQAFLVNNIGGMLQIIRTDIVEQEKINDARRVKLTKGGYNG